MRRERGREGKRRGVMSRGMGHGRGATGEAREGEMRCGK